MVNRFKLFQNFDQNYCMPTSDAQVHSQMSCPLIQPDCNSAVILCLTMISQSFLNNGTTLNPQDFKCKCLAESAKMPIAQCLCVCVCTVCVCVCVCVCTVCVCVFTSRAFSRSAVRSSVCLLDSEVDWDVHSERSVSSSLLFSARVCPGKTVTSHHVKITPHA